MTGAVALATAQAAQAAVIPISTLPTTGAGVAGTTYLEGGNIYIFDDANDVTDVRMNTAATGAANDFNTNSIISQSNATGSGTWSMSIIPVFDARFELVLDIQEPSSNAAKEYLLTSLVLAIDGHLLFDLSSAAPLVFNAVVNHAGVESIETPSPTNNQADVSLLLPIARVMQVQQYVREGSNGYVQDATYTATAASTLSISWTQVGEGSNDEWVVRKTGAFFTGQEVIYTPPIPLPASLALLPAGLAAIGVASRRRRRG